MKTTRRRNMAALTFIVFLAAVYAVILLAGRPGGGGGDGNAKEIAPVSTVKDTYDAKTDTAAAVIEKKSHGKNKKNRKKGVTPKGARQNAPDNPDVFDRPVPAAVP